MWLYKHLLKLNYTGIWNNCHKNRDQCIETYVMAMTHHSSTRTNCISVYKVLSIAWILTANDTDNITLVRLQQKTVVINDTNAIHIILLILLIHKEVDLENSYLNIQAKYGILSIINIEFTKKHWVKLFIIF